MAKVFTNKQPVARGFVNAEDFSQEAHESLSEFNGALGPEQLPMGRFDSTRFVANANIASEVFSSPGGASSAVATRMPTALYAITKSNVTDLTGYDPPDGGAGGLTGILGPAQKTYATNSNDWAPGWNKLSDYIDLGVYLSVPARAGMIKGAAIADIEFYYGDAAVYGLGSALTGANWRYELGVFLDGVLIARSGLFAPRRHTHHLNFSFPSANRRAVIDVRWRGYFDGAGTNQNYSWVSDSAIKFLNTQLWVMNRYR